jgi:putative aldouronate transport system permease protein
MVEKSKSFQIGANIVMLLASLICLLPFMLMLSSSVTEETDLLQHGYSFLPRSLDFSAYRFLLSETNLIMRSYFVTIVVTLIGTSVSMILTTLMAYPLSRKDLPGRNAIAFFVYFTMLFNGGLVPSYIMWTQFFKIKNKIAALIIPFLLLNAFYVIMMRTYFSTNVPDAIIEAARMDGASEITVLIRVVIPMSLPIIATVSLLVGLNYWNNWTNGLYFITDSHLFSLQNLLNRMLRDLQFLLSGAVSGSSAESALNLPSTAIRMAIATMGAIPILIVFPFFQKYFVKGISIGAVKE